MTKRPPNILLTIADDQRGSALGCAGVEAVQTPALDALAARGVRFSNAHHLGSCHGALCAPSRAMLFTGQPYFNLDQSLIATWDYPRPGHPPVPPMLGGRLGTMGYKTFATGKWHNGVHSFRECFADGANIFFGGMADHWFTPVHDFDPTGSYPRHARRRADGFSTEVFARAAIDFIRSRRGNEDPFFCYCAFTAPHDPRTPPDDYRRQYDPSRIEIPPNICFRPYDGCLTGAQHEFDNGALINRDENLLGTPRDSKALQRTIAEYYGMVSHMDTWIGRIHDAVVEAGLLENTLIIHTADHGLAVGQHGLLGKQNLYNHSVTVPLLMAGPSIPRGQVCEDLVYQHDLHPTLLDVAGSPSSGSSPVFTSLIPTLQQREGGRTHVGCAFASTQRMVRDDRYKLIEYRIEGERHTQLFDLRDDPWELQNLAGNPGMAPKIADLRKQLGLWQASANDPHAGFCE